MSPITEQIVAQSKPLVPMEARGKFADGQTHNWQIVAFATIERSWDGAVRDTTFDALVITEDEYVVRFRDLEEELDSYDEADREWKFVNV